MLIRGLNLTSGDLTWTHYKNRKFDPIEAKRAAVSEEDEFGDPGKIWYKSDPFIKIKKKAFLSTSACKFKTLTPTLSDSIKNLVNLLTNLRLWTLYSDGLADEPANWAAVWLKQYFKYAARILQLLD